MSADFPMPELLTNCTEPDCYSVSETELHYRIYFLVISLLILVSAFLLSLEILIRWMAQKINPNLEIPKAVKIIYNLIFIVGFIASFCFIFFLGYVFLQYSF